ncbi:MAG: sugar phosphate isomerase/epimerase family protein [Propioniciclava sp.]
MLDVAFQLSGIAPTATGAELAGVLTSLREAGYRRVVVPRWDLTGVDLHAAADVLAAAEIAPIAMCGQTPDADVSSADPAIAARGLATLRGAVDTATILGADQLNGVPYGCFGPTAALPEPAAFERAARAVGIVADEAAARGVSMTFEVLNRYETALINTAEQAVDFVAASGSSMLRIHLDSYHMGIEEADLTAALRVALPHLGYLELGQSGRGYLDGGLIDLDRVIRTALSLGYRGRWGVETFTRPVLPAPVADRLAIWRTTYTDGLEVARGAMAVLTGVAEVDPGPDNLG